MTLRKLFLVGVVAALGLLWGCGHGHDSDHDHDHAHEDGDHEHPHEDGDHDDHDHQAQNGGTLVPLGEHFANVEILFDGEAGKLCAWVYDGCCEQPIRISQEQLVFDIDKGDETISVNLGGVESSLSGETIGDTSEFQGQNDALKGLASFSGTLQSIEIKGSKFDQVAFEYSGDVE